MDAQRFLWSTWGHNERARTKLCIILWCHILPSWHLARLHSIHSFIHSFIQQFSLSAPQVLRHRSITATLFPMLTTEEKQTGEYTKCRAGISAIKNMVWRETNGSGSGLCRQRWHLQVSAEVKRPIMWLPGGKVFPSGTVSSQQERDQVREADTNY